MTGKNDESALPLSQQADASGLMGLALDPGAQPPPTSGSERFHVPLSEDLEEKFPSLEILELIGSGGMGCVYKARQKHLDRLVALKILPAELGRDPRFAERFTREARALARLVHPNIVTIHDFGQVDDMHFLVMEYMDGMSLRELMTVEEPVDRDVADIMNQICAALQYAHDAGIVHRDIKPENILFDRRGHLKIADFGLVKLATTATHDLSLTGSRQAMGTLHYMAPEQWESSGDVDHRADLYALGVMLYELVTGRLPMGHFDPPSVLVAVDGRIDEIVMRAMQSNPEQRYQNAVSLAADLRALDRAGSGAESGARGEAPVVHHGTFTRFFKGGGRLRSFARRVARHAESEKADESLIPWGTLIWALSILVLSFAPWVGTEFHIRTSAFCTGIPGPTAVWVSNLLPLMLAAAVLVVRFFRQRLALRGDLLTLAFCAGAIAHVVFFYHEADSHYYRSRFPVVTFVPGVVAVLFGLLMADRVLVLVSRFFTGVADSAKSLPWRSWVDSMNERAARARERAEAKSETERREKAQSKKAFFCRLRKAGIGPKRMWDAFGVADEPTGAASAVSPPNSEPSDTEKEANAAE